MATSYIGVRVADGTYYPIFEIDFRGKKRMVLTTVRDDQSTVQIDLYRGDGTEMANPEYVGTLLIEHIEQGQKGEPEISLLVGLDQNGNLNATASDTKTGEYQSLSVSLSELSDEETYDVPDFELDDSSISDPETFEETEEESLLEEAPAAAFEGEETGSEPEESSSFDEQLGEFEQISFGEEDDAEESSGHSYDEEAPGIRGVDPASAESRDFEIEQFSEENDVEDFTFDDELEAEGPEELEGSEAGETEQPAALEENRFAEGQFDDDQFEAGELEEPELDESEFEEPAFDEAGLTDDVFGEDQGVERGEDSLEAAEAPAAPDEAPFEDGRIPEKYRPETRINPFVLASFIILALAACGIIAYVVFTALQPAAGGTESSFLVLGTWVPLRTWRAKAKRSFLHRVLRL